MSERCSFVTEFIYCDKCFDSLIVNMERLREEKFFEPFRNGRFNIISGKIGGLFDGNSFLRIEELADDLSHNLCHDVRVVVVSEETSRNFLLGRCRSKIDSEHSTKEEAPLA